MLLKWKEKKNTSGVTVSKFFKQMRKRQNDRAIDRGNQHDNNTTTHNGFIAYIFFLKWYYSCKLNLKNRLIWAHKTKNKHVETYCQQNNVSKHLKKRIIGFQYNYIQKPLHTNTENSLLLINQSLCNYWMTLYLTCIYANPFQCVTTLINKQ
jgi:hypothetical protein